MARAYSYASAPDVRRLLTFLPQVVPATNPASPIAEASAYALWPASYKPNPSDVAGYVEMASNDLDGVLGLADYTTPVPTTATAALETLRTWTAEGAAALAAGAMPQGADSKHQALYSERFTALLMSIQNKSRLLAGAPRDSNVSAPRYHHPPASGPGASPFFSADSINDR